jgi:hypothetical protein
MNLIETNLLVEKLVLNIMKAIINFLKRTHWFKASVAFLTSLMFLILPSCQKDELDQGSITDMDGLLPSAISKKRQN